MKKIGIVTSFQEYNYGAMLQAFALQKKIENLGYIAEIIWLKGGLVKFRDIRLKKILIMGIKLFFNLSLLKKTIKTYGKVYRKNITEESKSLFEKFYNENYKIKLKSYSKWKKIAKKDEYLGFLCGSDQIWNTTAVYIEPMYYLQFSPKNKRIAYAPSMGKDYIPKYNKNKLKKYIGEIPNLSIREEKGKELIRELTNREAQVVLDPTFLLSKEEWQKIFSITHFKKKKYILCYFLDIPIDNTYKFIKEVQKKYGLEAVFLPYKEEWQTNFNNYVQLAAGPKEFLEVLLNSEYVITDSFHGTIFSINFNIEFYTVKRQYGSNDSQESRITGILEKFNLLDRLIDSKEKNYEKLYEKINWHKVNEKLERERKDSEKYLKNSIEKLCKEGVK